MASDLSFCDAHVKKLDLVGSGLDRKALREYCTKDHDVTMLLNYYTLLIHVTQFVLRKHGCFFHQKNVIFCKLSGFVVPGVIFETASGVRSTRRPKVLWKVLPFVRKIEAITVKAIHFTLLMSISKYMVQSFGDECFASATWFINEIGSRNRVRIISCPKDGIHDFCLSSSKETIHALSKRKQVIGYENYVVDVVGVAVNVIHSICIHP